MKILIVILMVIPSIIPDTIVLMNLTPDEAFYIMTNSHPDLEFAPLIEQGRTKDNQQEKIYVASQFHGQDGLGNVIFGYKDWNQARVESRNLRNQVVGSYRYVDANGDDIKVHYKADETGFHQVDNRPKPNLPQPVTDTPEVKEAREKHAEAWRKAAAAAAGKSNGINDDPLSDYYNRHAIKQEKQQKEYEARIKRLSSILNDKLPYEYASLVRRNNYAKRALRQNDQLQISTPVSVNKSRKQSIRLFKRPIVVKELNQEEPKPDIKIPKNGKIIFKKILIKKPINKSHNYTSSIRVTVPKTDDDQIFTNNNIRSSEIYDFINRNLTTKPNIDTNNNSEDDVVVGKLNRKYNLLKRIPLNIIRNNNRTKESSDLTKSDNQSIIKPITSITHHNENVESESEHEPSKTNFESTTPIISNLLTNSKTGISTTVKPLDESTTTRTTTTTTTTVQPDQQSAKTLINEETNIFEKSTSKNNFKNSMKHNSEEFTIDNTDVVTSKYILINPSVVINDSKITNNYILSSTSKYNEVDQYTDDHNEEHDVELKLVNITPKNELSENSQRVPKSKNSKNQIKNFEENVGEELEDIIGEPKGFFYQVQYPVSVVSSDNNRKIRATIEKTDDHHDNGPSVDSILVDIPSEKDIDRKIRNIDASNDMSLGDNHDEGSGDEGSGDNNSGNENQITRHRDKRSEENSELTNEKDILDEIVEYDGEIKSRRKRFEKSINNLDSKYESSEERIDHTNLRRSNRNINDDNNENLDLDNKTIKLDRISRSVEEDITDPELEKKQIDPETNRLSQFTRLLF